MSTRSETLPVDPSDTWRVLVATARGASHEVADTPNQDAARFASLEEIGPGALVAAIADGHGNRRHFRSDRGSLFAVDSACESIAAMTGRLARSTTGDQLQSLATGVIIPDIVDRWRTMVSSDVVDRPFTSNEEAQMAEGGDQPVVAYGATLLVVVMWDQQMLLMQIGDGNTVALRSNRVVLLPIPDDPSLDGQHTTSMCQSNAIDSFRVAAIDLAATDLVGVLLATDGFGNAQAADPWEPAVGADLVDMVRAQGVDWVEQQLPEWVKQCASADGSADDTTVALLLAPASDHPSGDLPIVPGPERAEATTSSTLPLEPESIPEPLVSRDSVHVDAGSTPAAEELGHHPRSSRRWLPLTIAAALVAVIAVVVALYLGDSGSAPPTSPPASTARNPGVITVTARNSRGQTISVMVPKQITKSGRVVASAQIGDQLFVLVGDRVWRFYMTDHPDPLLIEAAGGAGATTHGRQSRIDIPGQWNRPGVRDCRIDDDSSVSTVGSDTVYSAGRDEGG